MEKICNKCFKFKSLEEFTKHSSHKDGRRNRCKLCTKLYLKNYYLNNKEDILKQQKEFSKEYNKNYRIKNKDKIKKYNKEYTKKRFKNDNIFRLKMILRNRVKDVLKKNFKSGSAVKDLGCSVEELKRYLESQFEPGMTWDNWGNKKGDWSIDHIIPLSKVDLTNKEEFLKVCHYTNLRPMWHIDNIKKGNKT